jgi:putative ABC transport system substrate-binding protein
VRRRVLLAGIVAAPATVARGEGAKLQRLAIISPSEPLALMVEDSSNRYYRVLFEELRRRGHIEGKTLTVERYGREQNTAGLPALLEEVVRSKPDVIYAITPGTLIKSATTTIPVVALTADPIATGLVQSLARPGGNITGVSVDTGPSIHGKRIELLREAFPRMLGVGYVTVRPSWEALQGPAMRAAAEAAGIRLLPKLLNFPANEAGYRTAIAEIPRDGTYAVMIGDGPAALAYRAAIVAAIAEARLPAIYSSPESVAAGGLMAYSFDLAELNRRVAQDIDAILRGANPGDIPFFQASTFILSINLKTAASIGITFPPSILGRADEVIE